MKVKIIKCSGPLYWYKHFIGEEFIFLKFHESGKMSVGHEMKYKEETHVVEGYLVDTEDCEFIVV